LEIERGGGRFYVTPGGPFRVKTALGTVTALGTEFSVKLEPRGKREGKRREGRGGVALVVAVTEGSVRVEVGEKSYVLAAGESRSFPVGRRKEEDDD
jgi:ferric-dicitrate binding protein FerR (iron transport regulator)